MDKNKKPKQPNSRVAAAVLGRDIQEYRQEIGVSQRELAKTAGTTQAHIARIESGDANPTLRTLVRIAAAFELDLLIGFRRRNR